MKKLNGLILFIVALGLIYTAYWFYKAHEIKNLVVQHLKEYEKPDEEGYHVAVEDVSVNGFPLNYEIKLSNPKYLAADPSAQNTPKFIVDGALKMGTDILGRSYWFKQEGDMTYIIPNTEDSQESRKYVVKGNLEFKADVTHPEHFQAFLHPFHGFPRIFYKENLSFQEILSEIKMASYEDRDFTLYEVVGEEQKPLISFSKGGFYWKHNPSEKDEDTFVLNANVNDLEAVDQGKNLTPHLNKLMETNQDMAVNIPYIVGSGKNNITLAFEAVFPHHFDAWNFINYKNIDIQLKKLDIENLYGHSVLKFNIGLKEDEKDQRNLHLGVNGESTITQKGIEAMHRQFIDGLKLKTVDPQVDESENKLLKELLQCCEDQLQDIIPDYTKLGKMQFVLDSDVKVNNLSQNPTLNRVIVKDLDAIAKPYGMTSHGEAEFVNNQPKGKYIIEWMNYKDMIHDLVSYFNRIHPLIVKVAEANKQEMPFDAINESQEKEIVDFFKSISNDPAKDSSTAHITVDFTDFNDIKIGPNTVDQVVQAWQKLIFDLRKPLPERKESTPVVPEQKSSEKPIEEKTESKVPAKV